MSKLIRIHLQSTFFTYVPKTFACFSFKFILARGTQLIDLSSPRIVTHYFAKKPLEKYFRGSGGGYPWLRFPKPEIGHFGQKMKFVLSPPEGSLTTLVHWECVLNETNLCLGFGYDLSGTSEMTFGKGVWVLRAKMGRDFFGPNTYLVKFFLCFQKCSVWWVTHNQQ